jgi:uncharacterized protein (TIGR02147 family)
LESYEDYAAFLKDEYKRRSSANASYSLRAFARDLDVPPSRLSEVFSGKTGFSPATAAKVAERLRLDAPDRKLFMALVESRHGRSQLRKTRARGQLEQMRRDSGFKRVEEKAFRAVAEWPAQALLELVRVEGFQPQASWIADRLGLTLEKAQRAIDALFATGQLREQDGKWVPSEPFRTAGDALPSFSVRNIHKGLLHKALDAIDHQSVDKRDIAALVVALDEEQLNEAKQLVRRFVFDFSALCARSKSKTRVYALAVQLFGLDKADPFDGEEGGHA